MSLLALTTRPGEFFVEPATLINLGFEWRIEGYDNRTAKVEVSYRKQGETQWKQGLPLFRLQGEQIYYQSPVVFNVVSPDMFAGSILDLEPDTSYEARFVLSDPDGLMGQTGKPFAKTAIVRTRAEPKPYSSGKVYHVYHPDYKGPKTEPAFDAVMCAYNYSCGGGDTVTAARPRVKAGDTILVHAGVYKYHPEYYGSVMKFPAILNDHSVNATVPFEVPVAVEDNRPVARRFDGDGFIGRPVGGEIVSAS